MLPKKNELQGFILEKIISPKKVLQSLLFY